MTHSRSIAISSFSFLFLLVVPGQFLAADAVGIELQTDQPERIVLRYTFGDYTSDKVSIEGITHHEIRIAGEALTLERGAPSLPRVNRGLVIPDDAKMSVRVLESVYHETSTRIAPSRGNLSRDVRPDELPYSFGAPYAIDAFYPGSLATLAPPYILRDHRGIVVQVHPFQYNPVRGVLRVYTEIVVELTVAGPGEINVLHRDRTPARPSRTFEEIYRARFLNYGSRGEGRELVEEGSMLILCHDAWIENMAPFVAHKAAVGIPASVVGISTIGNTTGAIQDYIQAVYDSSDLAFVLLVGDIAQIASPDVWANGEWGASDSSYSKLAGGDDYPEILVGRFSAGSAAHVDTQVQRTIEYESLPATEQEWFWRGTGIASNEGAGIGDEGQSDIQHEDEIRAWLLGGGYTAVDRIYDPGASDAAVASALNAGRGVINYTGHGYSGGWSSSGFNTADVNSLTNSGKLPFILSVACNNGEFENYATCFGEAWLRATHDGEPSGAVGVYASSVSQSWAPPMEAQDEFNLLLTDPNEPFHSLGGLCFAASISMIDAYGPSGAEMFNTWVLFGDPSLRVIGLPIPPTGMKVTPQNGLIGDGPAGGPVAPQAIEYTVRNFDPTPMDYQATATVPWIAVQNGSGTIPPDGSAQVTVSFNDTACNLDHGHYAGSVEFVNLTRHEGDAQREAALAVGAPVLRDRMDLDQDPGWSTEGHWDFGVPTGLGGWGLGNPDPVAGATGTNVYGAKLTGDIPPSVGGPWYLTTGTFDFSGSDSVILKFQRWLNTQSNPPMSSSIEVSADGTTWHPLWSNVADVTDAVWTPVEYDATAVAAGQSDVRFRWGYGILASGAKFCSGWNIDDVEIWCASDSVKSELTVEELQLTWTTCGGAAAYDVAQGDLMALRASGGDFTAATDGCLANDLPETGTSFDDTPAPGEGRWFLVRGVGPAGPLTYQSLSGSAESLRDAEIDAAGASCP